MSKKTERDATKGPPPIIRDAEKKKWQFLRKAGFIGYVPLVETEPDIPEVKPTMSWEGGQISWEVWHQILAFFEWSMVEHSSEVQVRLFYHQVNKKWAAWAFPQTPDGMTTKELSDHVDVAGQRAQFPEPWMLLGTVHHHCKSGAFQSSTDQNNERTQEGVHLTVGGISTGEYSLDGRIIVRGTQYNMGDGTYSMWFDMPDHIAALPPKLHDKVFELCLKQPPPTGTAFPEQWKTNCYKPTRQTYTGNGHTGSYNGGGGARAAGLTHEGRTTQIVIRTNLADLFTVAELKFMGDAVVIMKETKKSHCQMDTLIASQPKDLSQPDADLVRCVLTAGSAHGLTIAKVDELFDKWDFETVLDELAESERKKITDDQSMAFQGGM